MSEPTTVTTAAEISDTLEELARSRVAHSWREGADEAFAMAAAVRALAVERDALAAEVDRLRDELADVRHSEAAFKAGRDEAQARARHHQERRIEAVKRAQAAERAAARGGSLRAACYDDLEDSDNYMVPAEAVYAYDTHGGAGQVTHG